MSRNDADEVGDRAAKGLRNENSGNRDQTRAVITGRFVARDFRQRPADRANRQAARDARRK